MNITISQITNGFVIAIASPKGQSAIYAATWDDVMQHLAELKSAPPNAVPMAGE